jgi:hypothetical protein
MSEYHILNTLQQMTMVTNVYKTQTGTLDKTIAKLLIASFSGQLKGWWDYHLTEAEHLQILNFMHARARAHTYNTKTITQQTKQANKE